MQREILCHIYPSKVPTLIHLARGKNLRWFPPSPGCVQDSLPSGSDPKKIFWLFCDLKKWPPKVQPKVSKWSPQMAKIRSKFDKMPALELVLEHAWKNDEKNVSKMRSTKRVFWLILDTFLSSGSKGVPGWSQRPSPGPSSVKIAPKWVSKWFENHQKSYLQAFWKRFSKTRALSMFPNSSGLFFSLFLFIPIHAEWDSVSHFSNESPDTHPLG